jgi:hypothetical protein
MQNRKPRDKLLGDGQMTLRRGNVAQTSTGSMTFPRQRHRASTVTAYGIGNLFMRLHKFDFIRAHDIPEPTYG